MDITALKQALLALMAAQSAAGANGSDDDPLDLQWTIRRLKDIISTEYSFRKAMSEGSVSEMLSMAMQSREIGARISAANKTQINGVIASLQALVGTPEAAIEDDVATEAIAAITEAMTPYLEATPSSTATGEGEGGSKDALPDPTLIIPSPLVPLVAPPPTVPVVPAAEGVIPVSAQTFREGVTILREVSGDGVIPGTVFRTLVVAAGMSLNRRNYGAEMLKRSAPLLEGRPIYVDHPAEGGTGERSIRDKVGWWSNIAFETAIPTNTPGKTTSGLVANMNLYENSGQPWFRGMVNEAVARGRASDIGVSILAGGKGRIARDQEGLYKEVEEIVVYASADAVAEPGADGRPLNLVASADRKDQDVMNLEGMTLAEIMAKYPEMTTTAIREARPDLFNADGQPIAYRTTTPVATLEPEAKPIVPATPATPAAVPSIEDFNAMRESLVAMQQQTTQSNLESVLRESGLPETSWAKIRAKIGTGVLTIAQIREGVQEYIDIFGSIIEAARPSGDPSLPMPGLQIAYGGVATGMNMVERLQASLDQFFGVALPADQVGKIPRIRSFKEFYVGVTGDHTFDGVYHPEYSWVREALPGSTHVVGGGTITMSNLLGTSMNRALVKQYQDQPRWWEGIVAKTDLDDMKRQDRIRLANFGSLTERTVDGAEYTELDWAETDENYTPTEYGNLVTVGRRAIINDNLKGIQRIPQLMASSAVLTLNEYVSALFTANSGNGPTLADGQQVFNSANHQGNRVTTAMSRDTIIALMKVMMKFNNDASKRIGITPRHILGPIDLMDLMYEVTTTPQVPESANNAQNLIANGQYALDSRVVPNWTDTNNWYMMADPSQIIGIELGFLFGREVPELLSQVDPASGLVWTNDVMSWKVRWDFGAAWLDYRAAAGAIVA